MELLFLLHTLFTDFPNFLACGKKMTAANSWKYDQSKYIPGFR